METIPLLTENEFALFQKYFDPAQTIVEFGSGGSTLYALAYDKTVYSVENNPAFYRVMMSIAPVQESFGKNLHYYFIDMGETNEWGVPVDESPKPVWWTYFVDVWQKIKEPVEFIFIDGRFRVMCAMHALKQIKANGWDSVVCLHDFPRREHYHVLLKFFDVVEQAETLVILKPKENIDEHERRVTMWEHRNDWR